MCTGAVVAAYVSRVVRLLNGETHAALRLPYREQQPAEHLTKLRAERAEDSDLTARMQFLWTEWRRSRGPKP